MESLNIVLEEKENLKALRDEKRQQAGLKIMVEIKKNLENI